ADELVEEEATQALRGAGVAGEQRPLHHLGEVDEGEDRSVEVGEVPPEDVGLGRGELIADVDRHRGPARRARAAPPRGCSGAGRCGERKERANSALFTTAGRLTRAKTGPSRLVKYRRRMSASAGVNSSLT